MPLTQFGRDIVVVSIVAATVTALFWVGLLMIHPTSNFLLEIKLLFHIP